MNMLRPRARRLRHDVARGAARGLRDRVPSTAPTWSSSAPGPGDPRDGDHPKIAAFRRAVDDLLASGQPFLAVCLGHQTLCERLGLDARPTRTSSSRARSRRSGSTAAPSGSGFYNTFVGRVPDGGALPDGVRVEADEATGDIHVVIGPHFRGIQFHAESILTENGYDLLHDAVRDLLRRRD